MDAWVFTIGWKIIVELHVSRIYHSATLLDSIFIHMRTFKIMQHLAKKIRYQLNLQFLLWDIFIALHVYARILFLWSSCTLLNSEFHKIFLQHPFTGILAHYSHCYILYIIDYIKFILSKRMFFYKSLWLSKFSI